MEDEARSLEDTVFLVVGLKVFIHATGVGHLLAVDLWQILGVVDSLLLVEKDVGRVGVNLLRVHFLTAAVIVTVPFLIGVFGIRHIVASSHDS